MAQQDEWIITRLRRLTERAFCPSCYLFLEEHDDGACNMRYVEDEVLINQEC